MEIAAEHPKTLPKAGWLLFEFTNSFILLNAGIVFLKWLVFDLNVGSRLFNAAVIVSTFIMLLAGPLIGRQIDRGLRPVHLMGGCLLLLTLGCFANFLIYFVQAPLLAKQLYGLSAVIFFYCILQTSLIAHNTLLALVVWPDDVPTMSSWGAMANWTGSLFGVLLIGALEGKELLGLPANPMNIFLVVGFSGAVFLIVSIALLASLSNVRSTYRVQVVSLRRVFNAQTTFKMGLFSAGFILFTDAALSIQTNLPVMLTKSYGLSDDGQVPVFVAVLLGAAVGAGSYAVFSRHQKDALLILVTLFAIASFGVAARFCFSLLLIFAALAGFSVGAIDGILRALFIEVAPKQAQGMLLGFYSSFQRVASILGPLVWIAAVSIAGDTEVGYELAIAALALNAMLSLMPLATLLRIPRA